VRERPRRRGSDVFGAVAGLPMAAAEPLLAATGGQLVRSLLRADEGTPLPVPVPQVSVPLPEIVVIDRSAVRRATRKLLGALDPQAGEGHCGVTGVSEANDQPIACTLEPWDRDVSGMHRRQQVSHPPIVTPRAIGSRT
jgi:hypothetical protein